MSTWRQRRAATRSSTRPAVQKGRYRRLCGPREGESGRRPGISGATVAWRVDFRRLRAGDSAVL
ncbi:hypothetical protein [Burkholderia contaminans]|uniref:hypothetical protein n=1 Tax=Burkholderia contaminans TaxID=488447 RepID=UPI0015834E11|nr:hypothetical protein [Burkholderia contaminans]